MKKLIAVISAVSAIGFAVALASTNDVTSSAGQSGHEQSAGMTDSDSATTTTPPSTDDTTKSATCTDENGVTFYKGRTGFDGCVSKMRKKDHKDQMGGTIPSDESVDPTLDNPSIMDSGSADSEPDTTTNPSGTSESTETQ